MSLTGRFTHAIVARIPNEPVFPAGSNPRELDLSEARREMETFCEKLRECGVDLVELAPEQSASVSSLWVDDYAVVINGTALMTKPRTPGRSAEIMSLLAEYTWQIFETPETETNGNPIVLEGSDVLFTGKEIFVGVHKHMGTNMEGVMTVAKTFTDFAVVPIQVNGKRPLKYYVSVAAHDRHNPVLSVGSCKEAQAILQRIEREATFRYAVLKHEDEEAVNCVQVNSFLLYRNQWTYATQQYAKLENRLKLIEFDGSHMMKLGGQLSQYCLLVGKFKGHKRKW